MKKLFISLISLLLVLPINNVSAKKPAYKKAYDKIVKNVNLVEKYFDTSYLKQYFGSDYKWTSYFLYDLDKNGTPEMFIYSSSMGLTTILTYKKGVKFLGCDDYDRINTKKKEIIVHGHWHGAGGSGNKEWYIYKMNKSKTKLSNIYSIDDMREFGGSITPSKSKYNNIKKDHINKAKKLSSFKKKKVYRK